VTATTTLIGRAVLLTVLGLAALAVLPEPVDRWVWQHVPARDVYATDWGRLLRIVGYAPTWLLGALVLVLGRWTLRRTIGWRPAFLPGIALFAAVASAGLIGEVLKILVRRGRPAAGDGLYSFAGWDPFSLHTGALGFPSTHAVVAFAAAFVLARLAPRTGPVWVALALGCGATRLLAGAHFASDIAAAALLAWGTVAVLFALLQPPRVTAPAAP
jgi:membrane-associated phospholipid phosphatase